MGPIIQINALKQERDSQKHIYPINFEGWILSLGLVNIL